MTAPKPKTFNETTPQQLMRDAPELLRSLFDHAAEVSRGAGVPADQADAAALEIVERMTTDWHGNTINFPQNTTMRLRKRDMQMYQEFNGSNFNELASKYNVTTRWVRIVVERVREQIRRDKQPNLF